jgi:response regulator RpfG family c-di-GMP phosphodiesterase
MILSGTGASFDPTVVDAFVDAFDLGQMEIPEALVI